MSNTPKRKPRYRAPHELIKSKFFAKEQAEKTLAARWGDFLANTKHTQIANGFLDYYSQLESNGKRLASSDVLMVIQLMRFKWDKTNPYPSHANLAARMGVGVPAVRKILKKLEDMNFLKRIPRRETTVDDLPGQWLGNEYDLQPLFDALVAKIKQAQPSLTAAEDEEYENDEED